MELFEQHIAGDPASWRYAPLKADLAGLAPSVLATAALDPLGDEGRALAAKLRASGCVVEHLDIQGTIHGFASFRKAIPSAADDLAQVLEMARVQFSAVA